MTSPVRDVYLINESDLADSSTAAMILNQLLHQIADRLDRLEGARGTPTIQFPINVVDTDGNIIGGFTTGTST